jgi:predicted metal-binding membrane protein
MSLAVPAPSLGRVAWGGLLGAVAAGWVVLALLPSHGDVGAFAAMWVAMTAAMMVPATLRPLRRAAEGSTARAWAFVAGFAGVWLAAGPVAFVLMTSIAWTPAWIAFAWVVAGAYQLTPVMRRFAVDCRSVPYSGHALRYGVRQGARCLGSCGPVMLAAMVTAMALPSTVAALAVLVAATVAICWQKQPRTSGRAVAALGLAFVLAGTGILVLGGSGAAGHHTSAGTSRS